MALPFYRIRQRSAGDYLHRMFPLRGGTERPAGILAVKAMKQYGAASGRGPREASLISIFLNGFIVREVLKRVGPKLPA
jgi:hypothetical protein